MDTTPCVTISSLHNGFGRSYAKFNKDTVCGLRDAGSPCLPGMFLFLAHQLQLFRRKFRTFNDRFDLYSFDIPNRPEDETGLFAAVRKVNDLISAEIESGIPSKRIIVGGISQGAALSILTGLTTERKLAGVFVLSGYVPLRGKATSVSFYFLVSVSQLVMVRFICRYAHLYSLPYLYSSPMAQLIGRSTIPLRHN